MYKILTILFLILILVCCNKKMRCTNIIKYQWYPADTSSPRFYHFSEGELGPL